MILFVAAKMATSREQLEYSPRIASKVRLSKQHKERLPISNTLYHVLLPRNPEFPPCLHLPSSCALFSSSSSVCISHVHSTIAIASPHSYNTYNTLISCNLLSSFTWRHKNRCTHDLCFMYSCHNSIQLARAHPHDAVHLPSYWGEPERDPH